jgi:hypothetical protein
MINLAGSSFDYGHVLFAVLQECEHRRGSILNQDAEKALKEIAVRKLAEIKTSYEEAGGLPEYWRTLERDILEASLPEYALTAIEQTRLERANYDIWRRSDPLARAVFALIGLVVGGLVVWAPFIPIWEKAFALVLGGAGFVYPEIKRLVFEGRYSRFLNRLIARAEKYQKNHRIHYTSNAELDLAMRSLAAPVASTLTIKAPEQGPFPHDPAPSVEVSAPPRERERS